jgi:type IV pilus biogenesis protein PilP
MQNNLGRIVLLSALTLVAGPAAFAESTSEQLTRMEAETLVLKAHEKQLEVQANILTKQNDIRMKQGVNTQLARGPVAGDPLVQSVEGIGKAMFATLQLGTSVVDAKAGDMLPNGMRVVSVRANEVLVETPKRQRRRLAPANVAMDGFSAYPGPGMPPLPAFPSMMSRGADR